MERDRPWTGDGEDRSFRLPLQLCQAGKVYWLMLSIFILQKNYFILVIEIFFLIINFSYTSSTLYKLPYILFNHLRLYIILIFSFSFCLSSLISPNSSLSGGRGRQRQH